MKTKILIIAITKNKYPKTEFANDDVFFTDGFNFCFIDDKTRGYKLYHTDKRYKIHDDYLKDINDSGILMIYDGDDAPEGYNLNLDKMFKVLNEALDKSIQVCLWYHASTSGEIEEKVNKYLSTNTHIIELEESSHQGKIDEVYTYIPAYYAGKIELKEIIEKCYTENSKERAFQYNLPALFLKLKFLKETEGELLKDKSFADFINHRDKLVKQFYKS